MTINLADNTPRVSYNVAQGVTQSSFTVSFEFFDNADLNVYVDDTLKTLTTDYTVTGGDGSTGSITMSVTGATGGSTVVITRDIDLKRTTDFPASGAFQIGSLNTELDKIIAIAADLDDLANRGLRLQDFDEAVTTTLPLKDARKGTVLGFNATTGAPEAGPTIADVQSLADITADIATLADIEDGTDDTDAIQTVAGISANVSTVAGVSSDVTTVAGISSDVTSVAGDASDIGTVAGISANVTTVAGVSADVTTVAGISSNVTTVAGDSADIQALAAKTTELGLLGTADAIADMNTLATSAIVTDMDLLADVKTEIDALGDVTADISTVAGIESDVTTVAGISANTTTVAGISSDVTTVAGISANTTTVAGISANVTTVAGVASNVTTVAGISSDVTTVAGVSTEIGRLGTADAVADMNTLGTAAIVSDLDTVAGISANVTTVAGVSANVTTVAGISSDVTSAASNSANITTVAGSIANVNAVGGDIANVNTTAANITGVNSFAERYRVGTADPTASLDEGDLFYNSTDNALKYYNGTSWASITAGLTDIVGDITPQLGGNLDVNGNSIVSASNGDIAITPNGTGSVIIDGLSHPQSDGSAGQFLKTDGAGQLAFATVNTDLSNDTSPQLAGVLDTNGNNIEFGDSTGAEVERLKFGAGDDLQIYHNGSHSFIDETGTGDLYIKGGAKVVVRSNGDEDMIVCNTNADVQLYYNNAVRLKTNASGVEVSGRLQSNNIYPNNPGGHSGNTQVWWKIGTLSSFNDSESAEITIYGTNSYSSNSNIAGKTTLLLRASNDATQTEAFFWSETQGNNGVTDAAWKKTANNTFEIYVKVGTYQGLESTVITSGAWTPSVTSTGSATQPASSTQFDADYNLQIKGSTKLQANTSGVNVMGNLDMGDNNKILLGAGDDLEVFHSGSNSHITHDGTGALYIDASTGTYIRKADGTEVCGAFLEDGAAELFYDGSKKFSTNNTGANVYGDLYVDGKVIHNGDTNTYIQFDTDEISIYTGGAREVTINSTGTRLGDVGNGYFRPVSGNYGSIEIDGGAHSGWEGYSIGGRLVFMHDNSNDGGIYNDTDNEWHLLTVRNGTTRLYFNANNKFETADAGANVYGKITAYAEGSNNLRVDLRQGSAKVWLQVEQFSTHSAGDSYNVSSVTDGGTSSTDVTINNDMNNAVYAISGSTDYGSYSYGQHQYNSEAAGSVRVINSPDYNKNFGDGQVGTSIHGDLA